jgi:hypothetical protein
MRAEAIYVAPDGETAADEPWFSWLAFVIPPAWAITRGHYKTAVGLAVAPFLWAGALFTVWGNTPVIGAILILGDVPARIALALVAWRWHRLLLRRDGYVVMAACVARREGT